MFGNIKVNNVLGVNNNTNNVSASTKFPSVPFLKHFQLPLHPSKIRVASVRNGVRTDSAALRLWKGVDLGHKPGGDKGPRCGNVHTFIGIFVSHIITTNDASSLQGAEPGF